MVNYDIPSTADIGMDIIPKIEEMARDLVPPSQMAALTDVNEDSLRMALNRHGSPARKAFLRGMATTANQIRKNNIQLAGAGSPDAIRSCFQSMRDMINDLDE